MLPPVSEVTEVQDIALSENWGGRQRWVSDPEPDAAWALLPGKNPAPSLLGQLSAHMAPLVLSLTQPRAFQRSADCRTPGL